MGAPVVFIRRLQGHDRTTFSRIVRTAGIEDFTFHDLRHCFASRLVMAGVDLPTVQALMGHKNVTMTMRYTHLSANHKQQAVAMLEHFAEKVPAIFPTGRLAQAGAPL
jgi:integrase